MPATTLNFKIEQGTTFIKDLSVKNAEGNPVDVTGWTGAAQMRKSFDSNEAFTVNVAIPSPGTVGSDGVIRLQMSDEETAQITVNPSKTYRRKSTFYSYDLELTDPSGNVQRILQGTIEVIPEVTR